jgi:hypothetical protein
VSDELLREIRTGFANVGLRLEHIETRLIALEGGVRMVLAGDQETQAILGKIEGHVGELARVTTGLRHAQDDLRERIERLEQHPEPNRANGT